MGSYYIFFFILWDNDFLCPWKYFQTVSKTNFRDLKVKGMFGLSLLQEWNILIIIMLMIMIIIVLTPPREARKYHSFLKQYYHFSSNKYLK